MGRNFKILITLFLLTVLYGLYYFGTPAIVNISQRTDLIESAVFKETGLKVEITNPSLKMGLIPSVWIKADSFTILNDDNSKALNVEKPYLNIRLLPLILKELDIKHFSSNTVSANFVFDKDSKLKLGQYPLDFQVKTPLKLKHAAAHIDGYRINLDDKLQSKQINLDGKYLTVKDFTADKHLNLSTIADMKAGERKTLMQADVDLQLPVNKLTDNQCDISGHIINLNLSDFSA